MSSSRKSASKPASKKTRARRAAALRQTSAKRTAHARSTTPAKLAGGVEQMARLLKIMARLRRPGDGCPWDLEQTIETIKSNLIEEAYEALDAMESGARTWPRNWETCCCKSSSSRRSRPRRGPSVSRMLPKGFPTSLSAVIPISLAT